MPHPRAVRAPRSLHPVHPTDILTIETVTRLELRPVCACPWRGEPVTLSVPHRGRQRELAFAEALRQIRDHERNVGIIP